mgnify:CR=1 FL=1
MGDYRPTREDAWNLLNKYVKNESQIKHALAVEAAMVHFAKLYNEDVEKWGVVGLIHDLDYDQYPDEHCKITEQLLREENWPEDYIRGVLSHGWKLCTDVEPKETMEKVIYTVDELTGLIAATALMRPSKSIMDMEAKSVKKKWGQKSFAAGVDRSVIEDGASMMDMELKDIIHETILGMREVAEEIGLKGDL